jgi:hypothetical protein
MALFALLGCVAADMTVTLVASLKPEHGASSSASGRAVIRIFNQTNANFGFARLRVDGTISVQNIGSPVIAVHIHRMGPDGPIVLLACGDRAIAELSPNVVALTPAKTYSVPASPCSSSGGEQTTSSFLPLASSVSGGADPTVAFNALLVDIEAAPAKYAVNVHTRDMPKGAISGALMQLESNSPR